MALVSKRTDLPLDRDSVGRFLPWLVAFMVYLTILAVAGLLVLTELAKRWDAGVSGTLTVQIAPAERASDNQSRIDAALILLKATPDVADVRAVARSEMLALLEPWIGNATEAGDLPLPHLIDVRLNPGAEVDVAALRSRMQDKIPGIHIDDHRVWLDRLVQLIRSVQITALTIVTLILVATVATVVFTTRMALAVHREAIEVLHLIGARDSYIAGQLASRAARLGLKGGLVGLGLAGPTLMGIAWLAGEVRGSLLPDVTFGAVEYLLLGGIPLAAGLIAMVTAHTTVMRTLGRMP